MWILKNSNKLHSNLKSQNLSHIYAFWHYVQLLLQQKWKKEMLYIVRHHRDFHVCFIFGYFIEQRYNLALWQTERFSILHRQLPIFMYLHLHMVCISHNKFDTLEQVLHIIMINFWVKGSYLQISCCCRNFNSRVLRQHVVNSMVDITI